MMIKGFQGGCQLDLYDTARRQPLGQIVVETPLSIVTLSMESRNYGTAFTETIPNFNHRINILHNKNRIVDRYMQ